MAGHNIFINRFISIYILVLFYFNLSAQDQCPQNYKLVEKFKLETNSNLIRVNGSIKGKNGYRFFARGPYSIYLHSDDTTYHCITNSLNRFKFGYIKPGIYKLKICSMTFTGTRPDFNTSIAIVDISKIGRYKLRILKKKQQTVKVN